MKDKKSIIIYFSRCDENYGVGYIDKGNTEIIAEFIQELAKADMFKVERSVPYPRDYQACIKEAKEELDNNIKPGLAKILDSIDDYEVIYIGGPIYWGYLPQPMVTQLEKLNWSGKIVKPFTTHEGSGLGSVMEELKSICTGAEILEGLAIKGSSVREAKNVVASWLKESMNKK